MSTTREQVRRALSKGRWGPAARSRWARRAAVAAILRWPAGGETELLFIRRARRSGDPWSGDMAFPGGRMQPGDADTLETAIREAREEVGLDLSALAEPLGTLRPLVAPAHNRPTPMIITPHVFALGDAPRPPTPRLNQDEVAEALWVPLAHFQGRANRTRRVKRLLGIPLSLKAYQVEGHIVWGLTLQMLERLARRLERVG